MVCNKGAPTNYVAQIRGRGVAFKMTFHDKCTFFNGDSVVFSKNYKKYSKMTVKFKIFLSLWVGKRDQ